MLDRYSTAQRLAFLAIGVGFVMCSASGIAPYWFSGKYTADDAAKVFGFGNIPLISGLLNKVNVYKIQGGLFWYCIEVLQETTCGNLVSGGGGGDPTIDDDSSSEDGKGGANTHQFIGVTTHIIGSLIALVCLLASCCRMCCGQGGRTVVHGIFTFLAACCYAATALFFFLGTRHLWSFQLDVVHYEWALYVYLAGAGLTLLASFALCCSYPESPIIAMMGNQFGQPSSVVVSSNIQSTNMVPYGRLETDQEPLWPAQTAA